MIRKLLTTLALCTSLTGFTTAHADTTHVDHEMNKFAYITSLEFGNPVPVTLCTVSQVDGSFSDCQDSGFSFAGLTRPGQIQFLTLHPNTYAYVTTYVGPVVQCMVDFRTGNLFNCIEAGSIADTNIVGIDFKKTRSGDLFAYLADGNANGQLWQCPVDETSGLFGTCTTSSQEFVNGLLFAEIKGFLGKNYLYLPDGNNGNPGQQVWKCLIDPATGNIPTTCVDSGAGAMFNGPDSIAFSTIDGQTFAYVANYNSNVLNMCAVDRRGNLSACVVLPQTYNSPNQIATPVINGTNYFYIADLGDGVVSQCTVQTNGTLENCNAAVSGLSIPFGITFWP